MRCFVLNDLRLRDARRLKQPFQSCQLASRDGLMAGSRHMQAVPSRRSTPFHPRGSRRIS
jgi:hypothetical protein